MLDLGKNNGKYKATHTRCPQGEQRGRLSALSGKLWFVGFTSNQISTLTSPEDQYIHQVYLFTEISES